MVYFLKRITFLKSASITIQLKDHNKKKTEKCYAYLNILVTRHLCGKINKVLHDEESGNQILYNFRVKELKKDTPVTPAPRPLTVPTTIAETDKLLSVNNKTSGLPKMEIQIQVIQL